MRQWIKLKGALRTVLGLQLNLDRGAETVLALPELLKTLAYLGGLIDTEPEESFAA